MLHNGVPPEVALEALARGLVNKLLHAPLAALNGAGEAERAELIALLARVYGLPEEAEVRSASVPATPAGATGSEPALPLAASSPTAGSRPTD
jgi:hypothetical protein